MKPFFLLLLVALPFSAFAEANFITIPGQGWHLVVSVPPLTNSESTNEDGRFSYTGADTNSGLTFSINTEDMEGGTNAQCRDKYSEKTKNNPYIVKESIKLFETPTLLGMTYRSEGDYKGHSFTMANSHGYFVKNGKCVDLHVSQLPYSQNGAERVESVVRTSKMFP